MEKIHLFLSFFEENSVNREEINHESEKMKKIVFSIFKELITDLDKRMMVDDLVNNFEIDSSSLWNSFDVILKPEFKKLNLKINEITKKDDFDVHNTNNSRHSPDKVIDKAIKSDKIDEKVITKLSKECVHKNKGNHQSLSTDVDYIKDNQNVDFFDYDEMIKFVDEGLNNPNLNDTGSELSDFNSDYEDNDASNFKYEDFFVEKNGETNKSNPGEYRDDFESDNFSYSENEEFPDTNTARNLITDNSKVSNDSNSENLSRLAKDKKKMDTIIDELEENIIKEKEWYKLGESSINDREKNSLLDIHLEVPQFSSMSTSVISATEMNIGDVSSSDKSTTEELNPYLENIVRQRILNNLFDNVKPNDELIRTLNAEHDNGSDEVLVEKSKLSLAEIYSKKYEEQVMGNASEEYSNEKKHISALFSEIMHKLDNLSNQYFATNIPILRGSFSNENAPALKTEDAIPVIISDNSRLAPQEIKAQGKLLVRSEMTRQEKKSNRNSMKRKIKKRNESNSGSKIGEMPANDSIHSISISKKKAASQSDNNGSLNKRLKLHHLIS
ncbi:Mpp10-like U3 processosome protein [Cryptosporidium canis]|uniref:Mpp10-like U3 processosome protein n=1 Tax=Cryptosporidium canis TaxID=195482 RepID=A0ABQ8P833_9CRYT|nr:Mpp10-like U3 processosome protein [Cryptosporidium canis]KAJ1614451.1 Mpp10-like U3 processosome protein [Cryptosporidium canis]